MAMSSVLAELDISQLKCPENHKLQETPVIIKPIIKNISAAMFLSKALEKLLSDKIVKKGGSPKLKTSCEESIKILRPRIQPEDREEDSHLPPLNSQTGLLLDDDRLLQPFEIACSLKISRFSVLSIDCLQKLIAYGHVPNDVYDASGTVRVIDRVVNIICKSFDGPSTEEPVQLQILKALLTIITSPTVDVHDKELLLVVRTVYNIFMATKNPINQATAKATLTQMLSVIFLRMEDHTKLPVLHHPDMKSSEASVRSFSQSELSDTPENAASAVLNKLLDQVCLDENSTKEDGYELRMEDNDSVCPASEDLSHLRKPSLINDSTAEHEMPLNQSNNNEYTFISVAQRDAFFVFRSLCRLAMKPFAAQNPYDLKSHELRSKILSLQLILSVLQNPGHIFKSDDNFIMAIKQYLCVALSKNGVCPVTEVFELTLAIFLVLLSHFKQHLKMQIEVFFKEIFLYVLENPASSLEHKWIVVESLDRICSIPQCVVDIYLNYDCDLSLTNVFEKLVIDLAKLAQVHHSVTDSRAQTIIGQESSLRVSGLRCLVHILKCMVTWSKDLYQPARELQSFLGTDASAHGASDPNSNSQVETSSQYSGGGASSTRHSALKDDPEQFESLKARKGLYEKGLAKFNMGKHSQALKFLQEHGLLGESVESVAAFLHDEDRLDQTAIGDFLGENNTFTLEVMYAFVDRFNFEKKDLVAALREFLSGFRLPGEAQKIDRLMEKFAARYCECNPKNQLFVSADTAYVLAFSIIMLTTDLHSSQIKQNNRMTKADYIKMNRGINDSKDLPEDYLGQIYDQIAKCEIKLNKSRSGASIPGSNAIDNGSSNENGFGLSDEQNMHDLMTSVSHIHTNFMSATHSDHVRPMFKLAWTPFLAAFSINLQDSDDIDTTNLCLEGIKCAIRIACIFRMETERDAYVQALTRFTLLLASSVTNHRTNISSTNQASNTQIQVNGSESNMELMKPKNIDCIRSLITMAQTDGNYLGHAWLEILRCISQLESAQLITTNSTLVSNSYYPKSSINNGTPGLDKQKNDVSPMAPGSLAAAQVDYRKAAVLNEVMNETGSTSVVVAVDKIFSGSVRLDGDAIVDFVKALCQVSREELSLSQPRTFSLQKVVEISYYNMGRIRLQWSRIWEHVGAHFTSAGRSRNENVAIFVVDSLRQLSLKLIEKGELPNFHFQKEFLRPFVSILDPDDDFQRVISIPSSPGVSHNSAVCHANLSVQDMVIRCINQLVHSNWRNIRSGWTNIFVVFQRTATSPHEAIVDLAFQGCQHTVQKILEENFELLAASFHTLVRALSNFACNLRYPDVSMDAIKLMRTCAKVVAEKGHCVINYCMNLQPESNKAEPENQNDKDAEFCLNQKPIIINGKLFDSNAIELEDYVWIYGWMPVFCELLRIINCCKLDVRTRGLTVFFEIVKTYAAEFKPLWWYETFNVIFCVFNQVDNPSDSSFVKFHLGKNLPLSGRSLKTDVTLIDGCRLTRVENLRSELLNSSQMRILAVDTRSEWLNTTCNHTLYSIVDVFTQYYDRLEELLFDEIVSCLRWCCIQEHEQLARSGTSCLETLILSNGTKFTNQIWEKVIEIILDLFKETVPIELITWKPNPNEFNNENELKMRNRLFLRLLIRCIVQFELIETVDNVIFYSAHNRHEDNLYTTLVVPRDLIGVTRKLSSQEERSLPVLTNGENTKLLSSSCLENISISLQWLLKPQLQNEPTATMGPSKIVQRAFCTNPVSVEKLSPDGSLKLPSDAMYSRLTGRQLFTIVEYLLESNRFASAFNTNNEQRNILWEAGFKVKAKPNLLKQETHSLACALRILFLLASKPPKSDSGQTYDTIKKEADIILNSTILRTLEHYMELTIENQRTSFDPILLMILVRLCCIEDENRFREHSKTIYPLITHLMTTRSMSTFVSHMAECFLFRCAAVYKIF